MGLEVPGWEVGVKGGFGAGWRVVWGRLEEFGEDFPRIGLFALALWGQWTFKGPNLV
jgi:hypothetical protein